jgi:archaeosortase B (VPXXXP-CTERM-specific)
MAKKGKKGAVPRPKGRGTPRKRELRSQPYVARLAAVLGRIKSFLRRNWVMVKGCLIFGGCILAFMLIRSWLLDNEALGPFFHFTAAATGFFLNIFGASVEVDGSLISSPDFSMSIVFACTGIVAMGIFASAVLAFPCGAKQKAIGIGLGIAALFVLNLVRTVSLFFIGSHFSSSFFDTAHFLIWQPVMIAVAIVLWLFWVEKLARVPSH